MVRMGAGSRGGVVERLMEEETEGHHQSGFRCHPNHGEEGE